MTTRVANRIQAAVAAALSAAVLLGVSGSQTADASNESREVRNGRVYGGSVKLGNGTARVYMDLEEGSPTELGIALTEGVMTGLPDHHTAGGVEIEPGHRMFEQILAMPENNPTPFRHIALGWNPGGHEPAGVYDKPHFDFHFYTIDHAVRNTMDPADKQFDAKANRHPQAAAAPAGYVAIPGAVPFMGAHWVNPQSPELNKQPFSQTFLFGSWDGELIFAEPMITKAFLEARPDFRATIPVAQPEKPGFYPSAYTIRWDAKAREYRVALNDFAWVK